jgi:hypothetical protein
VLLNAGPVLLCDPDPICLNFQCGIWKGEHGRRAQILLQVSLPVMVAPSRDVVMPDLNTRFCEDCRKMEATKRPKRIIYLLDWISTFETQ